MADGTRIFATLHFGDVSKTPLLCLPGLTRNSRDFESVVAEFAGERPILTLDFRGRGMSDHAADPQTYRPDVELADTLAVLADFNLQRVALLGTSRGGIVGLVMAAAHPQMLAGLFLNDVGPRVEPEGLLRIMGYVGRDVSFANWQSAAIAFSSTQSGFRNASEEQWLQAAKRVYNEQDGRIVPHHDPYLRITLPSVEDVKAGKLPELWALLTALEDKPVTVMRGQNSDLLSEETFQRMKDALPQTEATTVPNRGHVPFLDEAESVDALRRWLKQIDAAT